MGSGKTTTTKLLNEKLPDAARVALPDIKRLIPSYRENEKTLTVIREVMKAMVDKYLELGVSVIVELITKADGIDSFRSIALKHSASFFAYRLSAPKEIRMKRVCERTKEMTDGEELPQTKIAELKGYFKPNDQFYSNNPADRSEIIDTQALNSNQIVETILNKLS